MKRTTIYLEEKDRQELKALQTRYGLTTFSDAIRLAIRVLGSLSTEEKTALNLFRPKRRKQTDILHRREAFAARAKEVSEEAKRAFARVEEYLEAAKVRTSKAGNKKIKPDS